MADTRPSTPMRCADCIHHKCSATKDNEGCKSCDGRCKFYGDRMTCHRFTCEHFEKDPFFDTFPKIFSDILD